VFLSSILEKRNSISLQDGLEAPERAPQKISFPHKLIELHDGYNEEILGTIKNNCPKSQSTCNSEPSLMGELIKNFVLASFAAITIMSLSIICSTLLEFFSAIEPRYKSKTYLT